MRRFAFQARDEHADEARSVPHVVYICSASLRTSRNKEKQKEQKKKKEESLEERNSQGVSYCLISFRLAGFSLLLQFRDEMTEK